MSPSAELELLLNRIMEYSRCPSTAPCELIDKIIYLVNPPAQYYVNREKNTELNGFNGFITIGGQGLLFCVYDRLGRKTALKIALPMPINYNREIRGKTDYGPNAHVKECPTPPDARFAATTNWHESIVTTMERDREKRFIVPKIYDVFDPIKDRVLYFAMEWIDGEDFCQYLQGKKDKTVSLRLILNLLDAIEYLHSYGLIHRDINARNLKVKDDKIVLLDFGLVRKEGEERDITMAGVPLGSLPHASPRLTNGQADQADQRDDIHAIGFTLWEAIFATTCPRYQYALQDWQGRRTYRQERVNELPEIIRPIFLKATMWLEAERYQNIEEMRKDLLAAYRKITTRDMIPRKNELQKIDWEKQHDDQKTITTPEEKSGHFKGLTSRYSKADFPEENKEKQEPDATYFSKHADALKREIMQGQCLQCEFLECKESGLMLCKNIMCNRIDLFKKLFLE